MKFIGKNQEYFEASTITIHQKQLVEHSEHSELILLWFEQDNNLLVIDNIEYTFHTNEIVCLTEFHQVEVKQLNKTKFIKWNKFFYCIINHDSEVGCKGILYYGAVNLPIIEPSVEDIQSISLVWKLLEQELSEQDSLQQEMLQMTLKRLLVLCTRIYKSQINFQDISTDSADIIREYHFLVEKHFKIKHKVADYAELLAKSPKTLSNAFKKLGSKPPQQFIIDRKMLEARRLLAYSNLTISEVGNELGFSDIQSFSRFFKREEGVSPNSYKV